MSAPRWQGPTAPPRAGWRGACRAASARPHALDRPRNRVCTTVISTLCWLGADARSHRRRGGSGRRRGPGLASHTLGSLTRPRVARRRLASRQGPACPCSRLCSRAGPEAGLAGREQRRRLHDRRLMTQLETGEPAVLRPRRAAARWRPLPAASLDGPSVPAKRSVRLCTGSAPPDAA